MKGEGMYKLGGYISAMRGEAFGIPKLLGIEGFPPADSTTTCTCTLDINGSIHQSSSLRWAWDVDCLWFRGSSGYPAQENR